MRCPTCIHPFCQLSAGNTSTLFSQAGEASALIPHLCNLNAGNTSALFPQAGGASALIPHLCNLSAGNASTLFHQAGGASALFLRPPADDADADEDGGSCGPAQVRRGPSARGSCAVEAGAVWEGGREVGEQGRGCGGGRGFFQVVPGAWGGGRRREEGAAVRCRWGRGETAVHRRASMGPRAVWSAFRARKM